MKYLLFYVLLTLQLHSIELSLGQKESLTISAHVGLLLKKETKTVLNMEDILPIIYLNETFKEEAIVADNIEYRAYIYYIKNNKKYKMYIDPYFVESEHNKNKEKIKFYFLHKGHKYRVFAELYKKKLIHSSLGAFGIRFDTAKEIISEFMPKERYLLDKEELLTARLMLDTELSATIAGYYLIKYYNIAKKNNMKNPIFRMISRYNGGWDNKKYYNKFKANESYYYQHIKDKIALN